METFTFFNRANEIVIFILNRFSMNNDWKAIIFLLFIIKKLFNQLINYF